MSTAPRPDDPDPGLDVDAAFAEIVANFGERADLAPEPSGEVPLEQQLPEPDPGDPADTADTAAEPPVAPTPATPPDPAGDPLRNLFNPRWSDDLDTGATWDDEGHFVPPPPPPLPKLDPRRKAAWIGLFGAPALTLVLLVLSIGVPQWFAFLLGLSFVGGFGYLVATMPDNGSSDPWSGDDGAQV